MENTILYQKLASLPENLKSEVDKFVNELLLKAQVQKNLMNKPIFGSTKGMFTLNEGFNDTLEDFKEYTD